MRERLPNRRASETFTSAHDGLNYARSLETALPDRIRAMKLIDAASGRFETRVLDRWS